MWSPSWSGGTPTPPSDDQDDSALLADGSAQSTPRTERSSRSFTDSPATFDPEGSGSPMRSPGGFRTPVAKPRVRRSFFRGVITAANRAVDLASDPTKAARVEAEKENKTRRRSRGGTGSSPGGGNSPLSEVNSKALMQAYIQKLESQVSSQKSIIDALSTDSSGAPANAKSDLVNAAESKSEASSEAPPEAKPTGKSKAENPITPDEGSQSAAKSEAAEELRQLRQLQKLQRQRQQKLATGSEAESVASRSESTASRKAQAPPIAQTAAPSSSTAPQSSRLVVDVKPAKRPKDQKIIHSPEAESFIGEVCSSLPFSRSNTCRSTGSSSVSSLLLYAASVGCSRK